MSDQEPFGHWLKRRRELLDLTQHALAAQSECSVATIRKVESGRRRPSRALVERLAAALEIPATERAAFCQLARGQATEQSVIPPPDRVAVLTDQTSSSYQMLPVPLTPLIGREADRAALHALVRRDDVRLVTLLGPPGIGKTRLGLQVTEDLRDAFADGVYFVPLAPIRDASLVLSAIAQTLGVREVSHEPLIDALSGVLQDWQVLLALDNVEQVIGIAPDIAYILEHAPGVTILATSRAALRVAGEHVWDVDPLAVPDLHALPPPEELWRYPAVELFVQRARAVNHRFEMADETAPVVAELCVRLEGVPLAIELAAARSRLLTPRGLLERLDRQLVFLAGGSVNAPERHQSLRAAISWSYDLLSVEDRRLFRRLGVFAGGCTLDAIAAVCQDEKTNGGGLEESTLDRLSSLTDQSLLQFADADGEPRFIMLESLREFALEELEAAGEAGLVRGRHAEYFLELAERGERGLAGPEQALWLERLETEHDNLRAALGWVLERGIAPDVSAVRLAGAVAGFWGMRGYLLEGRGWLDAAFARDDEPDPALRARALKGAGNLAYYQGDLEQATAMFEQCLTVRTALGDLRGIAEMLNNLGVVAIARGDYAAARERFMEGLATRQASGDDDVGLTLTNLGMIGLVLGDLQDAEAWLNKAVALLRASGDKADEAHALDSLGVVTRAQGDLDRSQTFHEASLAIRRELDDTVAIMESLRNLGLVEYDRGAFDRARQLAIESLVLSRGAGAMIEAVQGLEALVQVTIAQGQPHLAARLLGAADAARHARGVALYPYMLTDHEQVIAAARSALGDAEYEAAFAEGCALPLEQALDEGLSAVDTAKPSYPADLTEREVEVLRLLSKGLTNAQIADALFISPRTVHAHLRTIYSKLGVTTRSAATRFAVEHSLV